MTIEYIRYRVTARRAAEFEDAYRRAAVHLAAAPECHDIELSRCEEEPESYVVRLTWTSTCDHLAGFRTGPHFPPFFAEIREFVEDIEEMRHYAPVDIGGSVPTLYEWAGGAGALEKLFQTFYQRVAQDELLAPLFAGMDPDHAKHVATWLGEVFGGPRTYSENRGGHAHMVGKHLGQGHRRAAAQAVGRAPAGHRRRGGPSGRPGVPFGVRRLPGVGHPHGGDPLSAGRRAEPG
ncbi:globin domain-containing protein [Actinokineospora sp. 24-640]